MKTNHLDKNFVINKLKDKQNKITRGEGTPGNLEGNDGEITIRNVLGQGMFLFYKWGGRWYSSRMSLHSRTTHERNEPVYLPKGKKPKSIGELTLDKDNKIKIKKTSATTQVVAMDKNKKLDVTEIQTSRASTTSMGTDNAGSSDLLLVNESGHVSMHLKTESSDHDPFIIYSHLNAGETTTLRQWVLGMDNNDDDVFNYCYKNSGTTPLTPSTTTSSEVKMALTTGGALTTTGTITGFKLAATNTAAATSDTDKFLVIGESGATSEVRYRTGAEVRSDIGAGTSSVAALNDLSDVTYSSGDLTISSLDKIISGALEFEPTSTITIDRNTSGDGAEDAIALQIDYDRTIATSGTNSHNDIGIDVNMNVGSLGVSVFRGINIDLVGTTDGTSVLTGMYINTSGGDKNYGLDITSTQTQIYLRHTTDPTNDFAKFTLADTGDLEISTIGSGTTDSDLTLDIDGDIELNADGGNITFKDNTVSLVNINGQNTKFYNPGGADSYCQLAVQARGNTTLSTQDGSDSDSGHITISPEGAFFVDGEIGGIYIKEQAGVSPYLADYGILRVQSTNPNNLYFTNDAGNDIQLTDGAYNVGQFGLIYQFGGYSRPNDTNHVYVPSYGGYYAHISDMGTVGTALGDTSAESYLANYRGYVCPKAMTLTNFNANVRMYNQANANVYACEFVVMKGTPADNSSGNITMTTIGIFSMSLDAENTNNIVNGTWDTSHDNIAAGDLLLVGIRRTEDDGDDDWNLGETYYNKYYLYFSYNIWGYIGV